MSATPLLDAPRSEVVGAAGGLTQPQAARAIWWRSVLERRSAPAAGAPASEAARAEAPGWDRTERRAQDPVSLLSRDVDALCLHAVDAAEIAAGLEAEGYTDGQVRETFGVHDVFALAERLYGMTPRTGRRHVGDVENPWTEGPWKHLMRGVIFASPGLLYVAALPRSTSRREAVLLAGALLVGWGLSQALAYLGYQLGGLGRDDAALGWLRAGLVLGLAGAAGAWWTADALGMSKHVAALASGQLLYLMAATVLLVRGREGIVLLALAPGLAGGVGALQPDRAGATFSAAAAGVSLTGIAVAAAVVTRHGRVRVVPTVLRPADLRACMWHIGYGLGAGALVVLLTFTSPRSADAGVALLPLIWSMGIAEWQLLRFRRRGFDVVVSATTVATFRARMRRMMGGSLGWFLVSVGALSVVLLVLETAWGHHPLRLVLPVVVASWLLGAGFFSALVTISLGGVRRTVVALWATAPVGCVVYVLTSAPVRVDVVAAFCAVLLTTVAVVSAADPTRHV